MLNLLFNRMIVSLFCNLVIIVCIAGADEKPTADLIIDNVTLISPHLSRPQPGSNVAIADGRIIAISQSALNYTARQRIDGSRQFLLPGLIDSHVHINHNPLVRHSNDERFVQLNQAYRQQLPRSFLYHGFTSIIDLDFSAKKSRWFLEAPLAPALYHCGRGVRVAGGYGPAFVPVEIAYKIFPNLVYEADYADSWPAELDAADYTAEAAVARVANTGAICLKAFVESGFAGIFNWPVPSIDTLQALAKAARQQGLTFIVHANSAKDWQRAISGGAEIIAHGLWHWGDDHLATELSGQAQAALRDAVAYNVALQPTIQVLGGERDTLNWYLGNQTAINKVLPAALLNYVHSPAGRWNQQELLSIYARHNPDPNIKPGDLIETPINRVMATTREFFQQGGTLLLGSDTPAQDGIGNFPGLNGYLEMRNWVKAGIPPEAILNAATLANARAFGLDDELGSIELGKQADLLLLKSNPLEKTDAYNDIAIVIVDGVAIQRASLAAQ